MSLQRGFMCRMALVYAMNAAVVDRQSELPSDIDSVAAVVGTWAGIDEPLSSGDHERTRRGTVRTELLEDDEADLSAWKLTLTHLDPSDSGLSWTVDVGVVADGTTTLAVEVDRSRVDGTLLPVQGEAKPPSFVRRLVESEELSLVDAGRELSADVWVVDPPDVEELAALLMHPERRLPVIGYTPRDDDVVSGGDFVEDLIGICHIAFVRSSASWRLGELLPEGFNVYGGAARIWWPGIAPGSSRWDHKLWAGDVSAHGLVRQIKEQIVSAGLLAASPDPRLARLERNRREREILSLRANYESVAASAAASPHETLPSRAAVTADLQAAEKLMQEAEASRSEAEERARRVEYDRDHWKGLYLTAIASQSGGDRSSTPEEDFRAAVDQELRNRGVVEGSRPRAFSLGPRFLSTAESHGDSYRQKILKACADVVSAAPDLLSRREDHPLRTGSGGNSPAKRRGSDQAEARRCYVEIKVPSARRIHYWLLDGQSVEFASVNVHDDMTIPE